MIMSPPRYKLNKRRISFDKKLAIALEYGIALCLAFSPLLTYYDFPFTSISLSSILSLVITFLLLLYLPYVQKKKNCELAVAIYILLGLYNLIISLVIMLNGMSDKPYIHFFLILGFFQIYILNKISTDEILKKFVKAYFILCWIISIFAIFEELIYLITGNCYPIKIPFLPLNDAYVKLEHRFGFNGRGNFMGFSPFFSEPAHMAQFFLPAFVLALNKISKSKNGLLEYGLMLFMVLAIIISTSSFGIAATVLTVLFYAVISKNKVAKFLRKILIVGACATIVFMIFVPNNIVSYEIKSLINAFSKGNDKTTYRLYRGIAYFIQFPIEKRVFGIGFNNFTSFIIENNYNYEFEIENGKVIAEYLNGVSQALIYNGFIGLLLLIIFFIALFKNGNNNSKTLTIALVLLMAVTATYLRGNSVFYLSIILMLKNERKKE